MIKNTTRMLTLARWDTKVNPGGALGGRLLRRYIRESAALVLHQQRVAREWASYR